jgi:hypothetical protein
MAPADGRQPITSVLKGSLSRSRRVSNNSITPFVDEFGELNDRDVPRYNGLRNTPGWRNWQTHRT